MSKTIRDIVKTIWELVRIKEGSSSIQLIHVTLDTTKATIVWLTRHLEYKMVYPTHIRSRSLDSIEKVINKMTCHNFQWLVHTTIKIMSITHTNLLALAATNQYINRRLKWIKLIKYRWRIKAVISSMNRTVLTTWCHIMTTWCIIIIHRRRIQSPETMPVWDQRKVFRLIQENPTNTVIPTNLIQVAKYIWITKTVSQTWLSIALCLIHLSPHTAER